MKIMDRAVEALFFGSHVHKQRFKDVQLRVVTVHNRFDDSAQEMVDTANGLSKEIYDTGQEITRLKIGMRELLLNMVNDIHQILEHLNMKSITEKIQ